MVGLTSLCVVIRAVSAYLGLGECSRQGETAGPSLVLPLNTDTQQQEMWREREQEREQQECMRDPEHVEATER